MANYTDIASLLETGAPDFDLTNPVVNLDYTQTMNSFLNVMNKIGKQRVFGEIFNADDNPFASWYREQLPVGFTIEDLYTSMLTGAAPDDTDGVDLMLKPIKPDVKAIYHSQNFRRQYANTISQNQSYTAFHTLEGIDNLINIQTAQHSTAINRDLMYETINLFSTMYNNGDTTTLTTPKIGTITAPVETGLQALIYNLKVSIKQMCNFNTAFNSMGVTTRSRRGDLYCVITPEVKEFLSVYYNAGVFNLQEVTNFVTFIEIPAFTVENVLAWIIDASGLVCYPQSFNMGSAYNITTRTTNTVSTIEWIFSYCTFKNSLAIIESSP